MSSDECVDDISVRGRHEAAGNTRGMQCRYLKYANKVRLLTCANPHSKQNLPLYIVSIRIHVTEFNSARYGASPLTAEFCKLKCTWFRASLH